MDSMLLAGLPGRPAALNLGGIANLTVVRGAGAGPVAYDTGPANALIDAAVVRISGGRRGYDADGELAAAGTVHTGLLEHLLAEPYYALPAPKTTGKELFNADYVDKALAAFPGIADADVVATLTALTAQTVADEVRRYGVDTLVVSGGGSDNPTLMAMLAARLHREAAPQPGPGTGEHPAGDAAVRLTTTAEFGAPTATKEAIAFALVGWQTVHGLPANAPSATGAAGGRILGSIVPGSGPLRLPEPVAVAPTALRLDGGRHE
jgi:anhydro-N-acetylmuramic acid kinase